jgi:hypothetical protein
MSHLLVYATADSRLHADLLIVRLKRAGIATSLVSVLYPSQLRPNRSYTTQCGEVTVSGMLGLRLAALKSKWNRDPLVGGLTEIGLTHEQSVNVAETLNGNSIVVAVENADEAELPAIFHTFRGLDIQKVRTADTATISPVLAGRYRRFRRFFEPSSLILAQANPA